MNTSTDGKTVSLWQRTTEPPKCSPLTGEPTTDVCVIGAGIAGLTTAYLLLKAGKSAIVLDDSQIGDGQTGRTSAHLTSANDDRFFELEKMHGPDVARICWESHSAAIDLIETISRDENIDCDFKRIDGYLFAVPSDPPNYLDDEFAAAKRADATVEKVDRAPLPDFDTGPALKFTRQARFHPLKYLNGLAAAIASLGGQIFCDTFVIDAQGGDAAKGELCETTTQAELKVKSHATVVATNTPSPINDWAGIYTKQASYRTYVIGLRVPKGSVTDALYWDTGEKSALERLRPYHYIRIDPVDGDADHDVLLVGGGDHKVGQPEKTDPFADLESWTRQHWPQAFPVVSRWSGQVQEPADALAYIGAAPSKKPNLYCITGDSGMGLTHATLGAMILRDLITGKPNAWAAVYDPSRKPSKSILEFARENLNAAGTMIDYVTPGDVKTEDNLAPGDGAVIRYGAKKLAVYREPDGTLHKLSAVCTHLYCPVNWNDVEKTWDCPCHGSRFACTGEVIMGPAVDPLKKEE